MDPVGSEVEHGRTNDRPAINDAGEGLNTGTAWTRNEKFDKDGYLVVKDLWDPEELYHPVPEEKGQYNYWDKNPEHFNHQPVEQQVEGSTSRYWHPQYRAIHSGIRMKLEEIIGRKLYNTYYYDQVLLPWTRTDETC